MQLVFDSQFRHLPLKRLANALHIEKGSVTCNCLEKQDLLKTVQLVLNIAEAIPNLLVIWCHMGAGRL